MCSCSCAHTQTVTVAYHVRNLHGGALLYQRRFPTESCLRDAGEERATAPVESDVPLWDGVHPGHGEQNAHHTDDD